MLKNLNTPKKMFIKVTNSEHAVQSTFTIFLSRNELQ